MMSLLFLGRPFLLESYQAIEADRLDKFQPSKGWKSREPDDNPIPIPLQMIGEVYKENSFYKLLQNYIQPLLPGFLQIFHCQKCLLRVQLGFL